MSARHCYIRPLHQNSASYLREIKVDPIVVALVDTQWTGHHPLYFDAFASCLLRLGCTVMAVCPSPDEVMANASCTRDVPERASLSKWDPPQFKFSPRRLTIPLSNRLGQVWLRHHLHRLERTHGRKIDFVFFACLYDRFLRLLSPSFPWPWAGLYLQIQWDLQGSSLDQATIHPEIAKFFCSPNLRGVALLDESAVPAFSEITHCRNVIVFPDFASETAPVDNPISRALRKLAMSRRIVGMAGHLTPNKGVATLAEVAFMMRQEDVCFAFVGEYSSELFSRAQQDLIGRVRTQSNVFFHPERIPCNSVWNGIFSCFDVCFAAYENFPHSSSTVSKSAFFRVPIIVSDGFLMGDRVRRHRLGRVVPQRDATAIVNAVRDLLCNTNVRIAEADAQDYLERYSLANLDVAMRSLLQSAGLVLKS